jgi:hypothetical protein
MGPHRAGVECRPEWSQHFTYADPKSYLMRKRKTKEQQDRATLADVVKEMAKPRVALSARERGQTSRNEVLVVKNNVKK